MLNHANCLGWLMKSFKCFWSVFRRYMKCIEVWNESMLLGVKICNWTELTLVSPAGHTAWPCDLANHTGRPCDLSGRLKCLGSIWFFISNLFFFFLGERGEGRERFLRGFVGVLIQVVISLKILANFHRLELGFLVYWSPIAVGSWTEVSSHGFYVFLPFSCRSVCQSRESWIHDHLE